MVFVQLSTSVGAHVRSRFSLLLPGLFLLAACGVETRPPDVPLDDPAVAAYRERYGTLFGPDALTLSVTGSEEQGGVGGAGIGVNAFLWRASLDTLDFMPLASADPFGGVIITEWYQPPDTLPERLKVNVFILDTQLRADAIKVTVFRQTRNEGGEWQDAPVDTTVGRQLEDTVLTRARELRLAAG